MNIGEFSQITGISASTLRYYESKGLLRVERNLSGYRDFSERDTEWARFLQKLKNTGMPLKTIKQYSDLRYKGGPTVSERLSLLLEHRKYIDAQIKLWSEFSDNLDNKIELYRKMETELKAVKSRPE